MTDQPGDRSQHLPCQIRFHQHRREGKIDVPSSLIHRNPLTMSGLERPHGDRLRRQDASDPPEHPKHEILTSTFLIQTIHRY